MVKIVTGKIQARAPNRRKCPSVIVWPVSFLPLIDAIFHYLLTIDGTTLSGD